MSKTDSVAAHSSVQVRERIFPRAVQAAMGFMFFVALIVLAVALCPSSLRSYLPEGWAGFLNAFSAFVASLVFVLLWWFIFTGRRGFAAVFRNLGRGGIAIAGAGVVLFAFLVVSYGGAVSGAMAVFVAAGFLALFLVAWMSCSGRFALVRRAGLVVYYLGACVLLPASLTDNQQWQGIFGWGRAGRQESQSVEGDVAAGSHTRGVGIDFRKIGPGGTWRNAVLVSPGGFFVERSILQPGDFLRFYVARVGKASGDVSVTLSTSDGPLPLWREACKKVPADSWQQVSVKLNVEGSADAVFELTGDAQKAAVAFADVHFEKVRIYKRAAGNALSPRIPGMNVIFVLVDALRADRLSMAGYKVATTPELDSLATRAVVFDNCLSQASWTLPSMGTIFTSLYPSVHGMETINSGLPSGLETLAECFQKAGYRTCAIQPNSLMDPSRGVARGFDEYDLLRMRKATRDDRSMHKRAAVVNDLGLSWLKKNSDKPFFLYLHYMDVHNPYWPPKEFRKYGEHMWQLYDGGVAYVSSEFAKLFNAVDKMGLLDNTTIVFTGDHGEQFMEHGSMYHGNCLHQEEVHVPLIIWSPVIKRRAHIAVEVGLIDLPVTILDLAGLKPMPFAQGRSLVPLMRGEPSPKRDVFAELVEGTMYPGPKIISLTRGNWRLISPVNADIPKLYNLAQDPCEHMDVSSANQALTRQMSEALKAYYDTQVALNDRLVKAKVQVTVTEEQRKALAAIGYLMDSSNDSAKSATSEK